MIKIDHVAIKTTNYDKMVKFFEDLFEMTNVRERGEAPNRQVWFREGIQVNEAETYEMNENAYDHFAIKVPDTDAMSKKLRAYGCEELKERWFALENGTTLELIQVDKSNTL